MLAFFSLNAFSGLSFLNNSNSNDQVKKAEDAFSFSYQKIKDGGYELLWIMPENYYLYKDKIKIISEENIKYEKEIISKTIPFNDVYFGEVEVFSNVAKINVQFSNYTEEKSKNVIIEYQGCWSKGICYPPIQKEIVIEVEPVIEDEKKQEIIDIKEVETEFFGDKNIYEDALKDNKLYIVIGVFFLAGLMLSLTPCVFPMIPILSSIIIGQGKNITKKKSFFLSSVYVLSMAVAYTLAGIFAGLFGSNVQASLQNPYVISVFSIIFIILAFSMFGYYNLEMPKFIQEKINNVSYKQKGGNILGVSIMGFLSALIVGPCMAAPLAGALIYIGQTGSPFIGGLALFSLSIGMGIPLIIIGTTTGHMLPKAGKWMESIKNFFGVSLIMLSIYMLDRIVSREYILLMLSIVLIMYAIYIDPFKNNNKIIRGISSIMLIYGVSLMIGFLSGNSSFVNPLKSNEIISNKEMLKYTEVNDLNSLKKEINNTEKGIVIYFYADWCVSCKEQEKIFNSEEIKLSLSEKKLIKVNITNYNDDSKELLSYYDVVGPPTIMFLDSNKEELKKLRSIGLLQLEKLKKYLEISKI